MEEKVCEAEHAMLKICTFLTIDKPMTGRIFRDVGTFSGHV